jgi:TatD DNase family protein
MLIDTHCHLQGESYDDNRKIIEESIRNDIEIMIVNGYDLSSNIEAIELANQYKNIYAAIGYGPSIVNNSDANFSILEQQLKHPKVVAIGEIGLDYYWNKDNKEQQKEMFEKQVKLAKKYKKPIIVHNREATNDIYTILKNEDISCIGGIIHCFNSSLEMANQFIKLGMLLGIGGVLTFKNTKLGDVIKEIPLEYIVLETDSPYLTPEPYRGTKNEPKYLKIIAEKMSQLMSLDYDFVVKQTGENALSLFDLDIKM